MLICDCGIRTDYQFAVDHNLNTESLISGRLQSAVLCHCHGQCTVCDGSLASQPVRRKERGIDMLASPQVFHLGKHSIIQREQNKWTPPAWVGGGGGDLLQQFGSES